MATLPFLDQSAVVPTKVNAVPLGTAVADTPADLGFAGRLLAAATAKGASFGEDVRGLHPR